MKKGYLFLLGIVFLSSCDATKKMQETTSIQDVFLVQNDKIRKVKENDELTITKAPFSMQFYGKRYNENHPNPIKVAAILDKDVFDQVHIRMLAEDVPNFAPATGLAGMNLGYDALYINPYGHHYLFYKNEEDRRLVLLQEKGENLKLEFEIPAIFVDGKRYEVADAPIEKFYMVVFIDRNMDGIMDKGELTKLAINWH